MRSGVVKDLADCIMNESVEVDDAVRVSYDKTKATKGQRYILRMAVLAGGLDFTQQRKYRRNQSY